MVVHLATDQKTASCMTATCKDQHPSNIFQFVATPPLINVLFIVARDQHPSQKTILIATTLLIIVRIVDCDQPLPIFYYS